MYSRWLSGMLSKLCHRVPLETHSGNVHELIPDDPVKPIGLRNLCMTSFKIPDPAWATALPRPPPMTSCSNEAILTVRKRRVASVGGLFHWFGLLRAGGMRFPEIQSDVTRAAPTVEAARSATSIRCCTFLGSSMTRSVLNRRGSARIVHLRREAFAICTLVNARR
jgi:hypothetical protein